VLCVCLLNSFFLKRLVYAFDSVAVVHTGQCAQDVGQGGHFQGARPDCGLGGDFLLAPCKQVQLALGLVRDVVVFVHSCLSFSSFDLLLRAHV
jgi:hypothetical protein